MQIIWVPPGTISYCRSYKFGNMYCLERSRSSNGNDLFDLSEVAKVVSLAAHKFTPGSLRLCLRLTFDPSRVSWRCRGDLF